jgi:hypothetical protein
MRGSKYNDEKATIWYFDTGGNISLKIAPGVNIPWGSKYHMTPGWNYIGDI